MPPTAPAAPVTRIGLSCLWFVVMSLTLAAPLSAKKRTLSVCVVSANHPLRFLRGAQIDQRLTKRAPSVVPKMWNDLQDNTGDEQQPADAR